MTPHQFQLVRLTLAQATNNERALGREFYQRLFVVAPDLRARFHGEIEAECRKLGDVLKLTFGALSDMRFLVATLEALSDHDIARELTERHCRAIGKSLLHAIEMRIGTAFTPQVSNAWIAFLAVIVSVLRPSAVPEQARVA